MKIIQRNHTTIAFMTISGAALYQFAIRQGSSAFTSCKNPSRKIFASPGARIMFAPLKASLEEGEDELDYISPMRQRPRPKGGDVAYTNENILRQQSTYYSIRSAGGADCVVDIYARDPSTSGSKTRFWFVGKVARCTGTVSEEAAVVRQYNLIEEHACRIRPVELGRSFGKLELYVAPGDTERDTNRDDPTIRLRKFPRNVDGAETVPLLEVGVNLEIVTNQGVGFHIVRTEDGVVPPDMIGQ